MTLDDQEGGLTARNIARYRRFARRLLAADDEPAAMAWAVGAPDIDEFNRIGTLEVDFLIQCGLKQNHFLIDVGCGSGRLASQLRNRHAGLYLGTDVSPEFVEYAKALTKRPDWDFVTVDGLAIPVSSSSADMVCFFSVLTHLRHEESFLYLEEASRVLRSGGIIVATFLDFSQAHHRTVFEAGVETLRRGGDLPVNQFISKDAIVMWANMLDLHIAAMYDGQDCYIKVSDQNGDGSNVSTATLGQSACVLVKRN